MSKRFRKYALAAAIAASGAFAACGGCDDSTAGAGAPDGTSCTADSDCAGTCGADNVCVGGNNATNNGANNGANNGGSNNGGLPDGSACTQDVDCLGVCGGDGLCEGGGTPTGDPDGSQCTTDTDCLGVCNGDGICEGGGTTENNMVFDTTPDGRVLCGSEICACDDGIDGDGDGLIDGLDPECTGPYDNDEATFATGIPGDNKDPKWQDCFFDGDSGAGNDGCRYHTDCLTGDLPADDEDCTVTQECFDFCRPRTPNGCDCFGCCGVETDSGTEWIAIGSEGCETENLDACASCQPTMECLNECGECELCYGRTVDDLPASCSQGGGMDGDACTADYDCRGVCGGSNTCEGYGDGGFSGETCTSDLDCRGVCGGNNTCESYGSDTGFDGDACQTDVDCRGVCGGDNTCTSEGSGGTGEGSGGYVGDSCMSDTDCRGVCGGSNTCEGYGSGGYNDDSCQTDSDCRGVCGGNNTCESSGSGSGSGVQCGDGEDPCPNGQSDCATQHYCQQGCCIYIPG